MPTMPTGLPYGTAAGRFLFVSQDRADVNTDPDYTLVDGTVKFTCSAKVPLQVSSQKLVVIPLVFEAAFDSEGYLVPVEGNANERGVKLPASSSNLYNPSGFTWKVDFDIRDARTGNAVKIPSMNLFIQEGVTKDLADELPLGESNGVVITRGPAGVIPVNHGTDGNFPRPSVTDSIVYWVGTARPVNALPYDWWLSL